MAFEGILCDSRSRQYVCNYSSKTMKGADKEVIVIGGGLGGLFTAAILSHEGYVVTVLEKNATAGGGLQTFRRCGFTFETGMHTLGGFNEGGSLDKICRYLGIRDELLL